MKPLLPAPVPLAAAPAGIRLAPVPATARLGRRALLAGLTLLPAAARAATFVRALTEPVPADALGRLFWVAWEEEGRLGRAVRLGLGEGPVPSLPPSLMSWRGGFAPGLRHPAGWTRAGRPVVALTMRFGAAAEVVALLSLDAARRPVRLGERDADRVEWRADAVGRAVLVLFSRRDTAEEHASCLAWDADGPRAAACP